MDVSYHLPFIWIPCLQNMRVHPMRTYRGGQIKLRYCIMHEPRNLQNCRWNYCTMDSIFLITWVLDTHLPPESDRRNQTKLLSDSGGSLPWVYWNSFALSMIFFGSVLPRRGIKHNWTQAGIGNEQGQMHQNEAMTILFYLHQLHSRTFKLLYGICADPSHSWVSTQSKLSAFYETYHADVRSDVDLPLSTPSDPASLWTGTPPHHAAWVLSLSRTEKSIRFIPRWKTSSLIWWPLVPWPCHRMKEQVWYA